MNVAKQILDILKEKHYTLATAESVTGGKIAGAIIDIPGASAIIEQGYIVYSDQAKMDVLNVDKALLDAFGVVSEEVALAMARGAKQRSAADVIIATTGEAGPVANEKDIAIGTICFAVILGDQEETFTKHFAGDRRAIIESAVLFILNDLQQRLM